MKERLEYRPDWGAFFEIANACTGKWRGERYSTGSVSDLETAQYAYAAVSRSLTLPVLYRSRSIYIFAIRYRSRWGRLEKNEPQSMRCCKPYLLKIPRCGRWGRMVG